MELYELLRLRVDRVIKMLENFEDMSEEEFSIFLSKIENISNLFPNDCKENRYLKSYINYLSSLNYKKYGCIFKGKSIKGSEIISKKDANDLVWNMRSLIY